MKGAWVTLCSIWSWFVLGACMLVWLPLMALVRLVTTPFDPGRYWVGYLFRQIAVVMAAVPTATSAYILAMQMNGRGAPVAMLVTSGTLLATATLPLLLALAG